MRVFLTGGTGFVGLNALSTLADSSHDIVTLVRESSPTRRLPAEIDTVVGDIRDPSSYRESVQSVDAVVHLASLIAGGAESYERFSEINVKGTRSLLTVADESDVDEFVFMSTAGCHPKIDKAQQNLYRRSKKEAEEAVLGGDYSFEPTVIYPAGIVGPMDYRLTRYDLFRTVCANRVVFPPLYTPGTQSLVHVDDVVDTIVHAMTNDSAERYLVSGDNLSVRKTIDHISSASGRRCYTVPVPVELINQTAVRAINELHDRGLVSRSVEKREEQDPVVPSSLRNQGPVPTTPVESAIRDAYEWYTEMGLL